VRGILVVIIDCLRADHLSCYGYDRPTTPTIDKLAESGTVWDRAFAASSWTKPSVASLFTGLHPTEHGVFEGVKRRRDKAGARTDVLRTTHPTLAETLSRNGWRCAAFINNFQLGQYTGLHRGFECYEATAGKADRILERLDAWLEVDQRPFFAYVHFLEAHWPYKPRRRHIAEFGGDRDANWLRDFSARDFGALRREISRKRRVLCDAELTQMIQMYDGAVRRLDGKIKALMAMLHQRGLRDNIAVIVTADHGEEFLDHGRIGHGHSLHAELTHVPLVVHGPGSGKSRRIGRPVSQVDLPATILRFAEVDEATRGADLRGEPLGEEPVFSELWVSRTYRQAMRTDQWTLLRNYTFHPLNGELTRGRDVRDMVTDCPNEVTVELYDVQNDPRERNDLARRPEFGGLLAQLSAALDRWWFALSPQEKPTVENEPFDAEIDERVVQRLMDLGYIE